MAPRFAERARLRPIELVNQRQPATVAPYVAAEADLDPDPGPVELAWVSGADRLAVGLADGAVTLEVTAGGTTSRHRSRRFGRCRRTPTRLAATVTGQHLTGFLEENGRWVARARVDLSDRLDPRDETWVAGLVPDGPDGLRSGGFGQLGFRDPRLVSRADGTPYLLDDGRLMISVTSAGPGFFDTGHASLWALAPDTLDLEHRSDLFFRRPDRPGVYGDHAVHVVRETDRWLVATSTWGDFDAGVPGATVRVTLAATTDDLTTGRHVLDTTELPLPTTGLESVGVWDPHLVHADGEWLVGYVNATRFFRFHPVLASGPGLDDLKLRGAATDRRATEGTTLALLDGEWRVLATDGRENRPPNRARYPVFDLAMTQVGALDAPYPSNLPWPTMVETGAGRLLIGFDGEPAGGALLGYGTHGDLVIAAER